MVRRRQKLFRYAVDLFVDLVAQVSGRRRVDYQCNVNDLRSWDIFMDEYGVSVGEDFIREFILYGIQSWFNDSSNIDYGYMIRFNWCVGRKAINRWKKCGMKNNVKALFEEKL